MKPERDTIATPGHRLEIVQKFFADGYTCECSCGWRSEEMAYAGAALKKGREHEAEVKGGH